MKLNRVKPEGNPRQTEVKSCKTKGNFSIVKRVKLKVHNKEPGTRKQAEQQKLVRFGTKAG